MTTSRGQFFRANVGLAVLDPEGTYAELLNRVDRTTRACRSGLGNSTPDRQWNIKTRTLTPPKHGSRGTIAMVEPVRERLSTLPRESEYVFTTLRGTHHTPSARAFHWNRVRCSIGLGNTSLYEATRHYFAWYLLNVKRLPDHVVAQQLRHDDGGTLVRELYGHPDAAIARERIRAAFRDEAPVTALPTTNHARRAA